MIYNYRKLLSERAFLKVHERAKRLKATGTQLFNIEYSRGRLQFKTRSATDPAHITYTQTIDVTECTPDGIRGLKYNSIKDLLMKSGLKIHCNCCSWHYWGYKYMAWKRGYGLQKEVRFPYIRNPHEKGFLCFAGGTPVLTSEGYKPIEDVKVGDMVFTHKGRLRKVVARSSHFADETLSIRVGSRRIQCTPNHPFLGSHNLYKSNPSTKKFNTDVKFMKASEFNKGDFFVSPRLSLDVARTDVRLQDAFMLGLYLGDGTLQCVESAHNSNLRVGRFRVKGCLGIAFAYEFRDEYRKMFDRFGYDYRCAQTSDNGGMFYIKNHDIRKFCLEYGNFTNEKYSQAKTLSHDVLTWSKEAQFEIVRGFFLADGTVVKGAGKTGDHTSYITLFNTNYQIISMLHILLSQWYDCSIGSYKRKPFMSYGRMINAQEMYYIRFTGKQAGDLYKRLGDVVACKKQRDHNFTGYELASYDIDGTIYTPKIIKDINPSGSSIVYNFEVEGDNSYIVNGVAVHNCKHLYFVLSIFPFITPQVASKMGKYMQGKDTGSLGASFGQNRRDKEALIKEYESTGLRHQMSLEEAREKGELDSRTPYFEKKFGLQKSDSIHEIISDAVDETIEDEMEEMDDMIDEIDETFEENGFGEDEIRDSISNQSDEEGSLT